MHIIARPIWRVATLVVLVTTLVAASHIRAATVTAANDYPSTLQAGQAANHTVVFTNPSVVAEGATITLTWDSAFDTSSITEDDVDIADDGVDLTTAASCAGVEQASVAVAADVVTITICAGDAGTIGVGSAITIEIGDHATSSGTGSNQIVNPSGSGTYYMSIAGTFGDAGSIALPIGGDDSFAVSATVDAGGSSGGPVEGDGCGDSVPPSISSVVVSGVTGSEATISWSTNEAADSRVDYGLTTSYELGSVTDTSLTTSHAIELTSLTEGVEYHVRVRSSDLCGNEDTESDYTFTTLDETAPIISAVSVDLTCDTDALFTWTTNEASDSLVDYGTSAAYGSSASNASLVTEHSVNVLGLAQDTTYHYRLTSEDASGNDVSTSDAVFTTNQDAAPSNASGVSVTAGDARNDLSWSNPSDTDFDGVVLLVCTNTYPSDANDADCTELLDGTSTSYAHTGLSNGTTYYYGLFAYDTCGQFASGALGQGTPSAPEEEMLPEEEPVTPPEPAEEEIPEGGQADFCGDGVCQVTESAVSCPADCQEPQEEVVPEEPEGQPSEPVIPPTTAGEGETPLNVEVSFFVANQAIELIPSSSREVRMLPTQPLTVQLLAEHSAQTIERVQLVLGSDVYNMALSDGESGRLSADDQSFLYVANVTTPSPGAYVLAVSLFYPDGSTQTLSYTAQIVNEGYVYEIVDGSEQRVGGATAMLLQSSVPWDGSPFGQFNPVTTGGDGAFAWYVSNGSYAVEAEKTGYESALSGTLLVSDNIVNPSIRITLLEVLPEEELVTPPTEEIPVETPTTVASALEAVTAAVEILEDIRSNPQVQTSAAIAAPVVAATAIASTATLAVAFDLIPLLQYLITSPFLFFWRRKRKGYGVVYNAISKLPIDLATVRLYKLPDALPEGALPTGRLVQSRVTDKGGRYFFLVQPGLYRMTVTKVGFTFASEYLAKVKDDGLFLDVYHGEAIRVADNDAVITANIPVDPSQATGIEVSKKVLRERRLRTLQQVVAISGLILSLVVVILRPSWLTAAIFVFQVVVYFLVRRLATPRKPKSWGIVYDKETRRPLSNVVVRVFEPKYNKLLETMVTDSKGRYTAMLGPNEYYSVYEHAGYDAHEVRPLDYTKHTEPAELSVNVELQPKGSAPAESPPNAT